MRTVDETKPYIWIEPTRPPADSSREFGDTAAIHLVVPNVSRVDVPMTRTERNAVAFDYFCKNFKDGIQCVSPICSIPSGLDSERHHEGLRAYIGAGWIEFSSCASHRRSSNANSLCGQNSAGSQKSVRPFKGIFCDDISEIAVGTLITERPPHRAERAPFGHSAPTSGI